MAGNQNRNESEPNDPNSDDEGWSVADFAAVGGIVGGIAAIAAGGWYLYSQATRAQQEQEASGNSRARDTQRGRSAIEYQPSAPIITDVTDSYFPSSGPTMTDSLINSMQGLYTNGNGNSGESRRGVPRSSVPKIPVINNLNGLINDIYLRYIALNDEDFENYYNVMHKIFYELHNNMKEVDSYYKKYSSKVQFAGSHPDRLRINKPDEFDIDIVIGLPLSSNVHPRYPEESDFILEAKEPGFIQLKTGVQFHRLPYRDGEEWQINRAAYDWKDDKNYILRSKFSDWFKSVVNKALNKFPSRNSVPIFQLNGTEYSIKKSESGPAMTLYVSNEARGFKLDVDLVPALKFPIGRWPVSTGYRAVPPRCSGRDDWMVVPKPNKAGNTEHDKNRSWRVALHEQEGMIMHDTNHMRQAIQLIKKLRDAQRMDKIASYYIKTLFFLEAMEKDKEFWNKNPVDIFKHMLKKFHVALVEGKIPYFWNKNNNLIGGVDASTLRQYANIVGELLQVLGQPSEYKKVAKYLLTREEYREYSRFL